MDVGANSKNRPRISLGWKMMISVWYLLILRGIWKVTREMSTREVQIEMSSSVTSSELKVKSKHSPLTKK